MKDEIKEILDKLKDGNWYEELDLTGTMWIELRWEETHLLLDYITNLQEELERYQHYSKTTGIEELKKENEKLKKDIKFYEYSFNKFKERFEKGTEYIKSTKYCGIKIDKISLEEYLNKLLNILNGDDE